MKLLTVLLALLVLVPLSGHAEESGDMVMCPAIWACQPDGSVMPEYSQGPCGRRFAAQCASQRLASDLSLCEDRRSLEREKADLKIRKLERKLRRFRRR